MIGTARTRSKEPEISEKRLFALIEEAIVDANSESEQETGFYTMLEEHVTTPFAAKVIGHDVEVTGFDIGDRGMVAVVRVGNRKHKVHLLDLEIGRPRPAGAEWIEAYRRWAKGQG